MDTILYFALLIFSLILVIWGYKEKLLLPFVFGNIIMMALGGWLALSYIGADSVLVMIGGIISLFAGLTMFLALR